MADSNLKSIDNVYIQNSDLGRFAGTHLLIEVCDAHNLDNAEIIEAMLEECTRAAGATLLHIHSHVFTPNGGISAVAVLAESHISIHTWPEISYAAMDVFMCGGTKPDATIDIIKQTLKTKNVTVQTHKRGLGLI